MNIRKICPGIYEIDQEIHIYLEELLDLFGWPHNEKYRERARVICLEVIRNLYPHTPIKEAQ